MVAALCSRRRRICLTSSWCTSALVGVVVPLPPLAVFPCAPLLPSLPLPPPLPPASRYVAVTYARSGLGILSSSHNACKRIAMFPIVSSSTSRFAALALDAAKPSKLLPSSRCLLRRLVKLSLRLLCLSMVALRTTWRELSIALLCCRYAVGCDDDRIAPGGALRGSGDGACPGFLRRSGGGRFILVAVLWAVASLRILLCRLRKYGPHPSLAAPMNCSTGRLAIADMLFSFDGTQHRG